MVRMEVGKAEVASFSIDAETRKRAEELAGRLGTQIPNNVNVVMWALPVLERLEWGVLRLQDQIDALATQVTKLQREARDGRK